MIYEGFLKDLWRIYEEFLAKGNLECWQNCLGFSIVFHCSFFGFHCFSLDLFIDVSLLRKKSCVVLCLSLFLFIGFLWCFCCFSLVFMFFHWFSMVFGGILNSNIKIRKTCP